MADCLTQQVLNLFKRLSKNVNRKFVKIVVILTNRKLVGSFGAVAGFAIAIIFTWKFLRPHRRPQSSQPKLISSESTSSDTAQEDDTASDSKVDPIDELHPLVTLTLGQIVKKRLNGGRKMICQLLGVILEESSPEELQQHATVRPSVIDVLLEISKSCDIYLMERIIDDESEVRVLLALENAGLFGNGGLVKDKVLFCSTENGRSSFVRHFEPDWHVDTNPEIISQLSRFIRYQLHISPIKASAVGLNIFSSKSLDYFFTEETND